MGAFVLLPRVRLAVLTAFLCSTLAAPFITAAPVAAAPAGAQQSEATQAATPDSLPPGSGAIVRTQGDCLRVRETPGLTGRQLACIPDGSTVLVLPSTALADGYRWQQVSASGHTGYVADEFLSPYHGTPASAGCEPTAAASAIRPGLTGFVPTEGGIGMVIWGGGTLAGIDNIAAARGCRLTAVWTSDDTGEMVPYLAGAPDFVNRQWQQAFPTGRLPQGKVLFIVCSEPNMGITNIGTVPLPGFSAAPPMLTGSTPPPRTGALAAVVIDEASGAILYEKDAHRPLPPASLTKIATAILAIEGSETSGWVTADVDSRRMPGSSVFGLIPGDCFRMDDMLYGLMLPSGNDAALAIGRHMGESDEDFIHQMNRLVARLGLSNTRFTDPHGLGGPEHRSSAYDLAMMARYGMTLPEFREVVKAPVWTANGGRTLQMYNVNSFINTYPGGDGIKTGYTGAAGRTLVASAMQDGRRVYVVLLNNDNRYPDARALFDWTFANHTWP